MADTANFGWSKPTVGGDDGTWGSLLNAIFDEIDTDVDAVKTTADAALPADGGTVVSVSNTLQELGEISGAQILNFANGHCWNAVATGAITFTVSNVPSGGVVGGLLRLEDGGAAGVTWPASFEWAGGSAPTLTSSGVDLIAFVSFDGGATFIASAQLDVS